MSPLSVLFYDYVPDILERRAPHREAHLALVSELHAAGSLVMGGALGDPPHGAALVFTAPEAADAFVEADPYVAAGLVTAHRIEPWAVVAGG